MFQEQQVIYQLGVALAIGLLVGVERGWHSRDQEEGSRVAGIRTFALVGLLGGVIGLITTQVGPLLLAIVFLAITILVVAAYTVNLRHGSADVGITSLIALLLTFALGAVATMGYIAAAAAVAVVATLILSYKPIMHRGLKALTAEELQAGIKLLLISIVMLPILPNQGYGPWQTLNPFAIWWMVVLIACISFVGYFAIRIGGSRNGILFTGVFGGLASSTPVTLHFAKMAKDEATLAPILATGILLACGTMFPRMLLVASVLNTNLFHTLLPPMLAMASITYIPAFIYMRHHTDYSTTSLQTLKNPLDLVTAVGFGILLTFILLLSKALQVWVGDAGVIALAAASGIADVDAITLSMARMSGSESFHNTAALAIILASAVNGLVKGVIALSIGGRQLGMRTTAPLLLSSVVGILMMYLLQ